MSGLHETRHFHVSMVRPASTFDLMIDKTKLAMVRSNPIDFSPLGFSQTLMERFLQSRVKLEVF